jgi:hypothetical protein
VYAVEVRQVQLPRGWKEFAEIFVADTLVFQFKDGGFELQVVHLYGRGGTTQSMPGNVPLDLPLLT